MTHTIATPTYAQLASCGMTARIEANYDAATAADSLGAVASVTVAGHPDVTVHVHSSTTVDGAVTVLVDAPEGTIIRFDVNDASIDEITVGVD
ncbi:hypothetical protein [Dietzia maris]|uniref:hypothetical protein n=1 Tax=Dietzia maris TaxID=37915 RepID=UPI0037C686D6